MKNAVMSMAALLVAAGAAMGAAITPGNLVMYRVGDGAGSLVNTGSAVFVDEYTPTGTLVQSIAMPTTGVGAFVASGTATSEGMLTVSPNGRWITITGYNRALGGTGSISGTTAATVNRSVAIIDATTGLLSSVSNFSDFADGNNPRSAVSIDGNEIWMTGGAGGIRYANAGDSTSTQLATTLANVRQVNVFDGQLFFSTGSGSAFRVGTVGTGLPSSSGQTLANLPGIPSTGTSPYAFFFADLDAAVSGNDTLYVADDGAGALRKYSLVSGSWTLNGTIGVDADDYRGLTGYVDASGAVQLFATTRGGSAAAGGGQIVSLTDASGYNGAFAGTPSVISTAITNTAYRGIGYVIPTPGAIALFSIGGLVAMRRRR